MKALSGAPGVQTNQQVHDYHRPVRKVCRSSVERVVSPQEVPLRGNDAEFLNLLLICYQLRTIDNHLTGPVVFSETANTKMTANAAHDPDSVCRKCLQYARPRDRAFTASATLRP